MEESIRLTEVRHGSKLKITVRLPRNHGTIMEQIHLNGIFRQCLESPAIIAGKGADNIEFFKAPSDVFRFGHGHCQVEQVYLDYIGRFLADCKRFVRFVARCAVDKP